MPPGMTQGEAELYRYVNGGSFPRWRDEKVTIWVLRYARMLASDAKHNNESTRAALDRIADRLINDAVEFASDIVEDAKNLAKRHGVPEETIPEAPIMANILVRQKWRTDKDYGRARKALTSPHFEDRIRKSRNRQEA